MGKNGRKTKYIPLDLSVDTQTQLTSSSPYEPSNGQIWSDAQSPECPQATPPDRPLTENEDLGLGHLSLLENLEVQTRAAIGVEQSSTICVSTTPSTTTPVGTVRQPLTPLSQPVLHPQSHGRPVPRTAHSSPAQLVTSTSGPKKRVRRGNSPRRPILGKPLAGRVYYMPDVRHVSKDSIIHNQKRQAGFFRHPMLAVGLTGGGKYAEIYALTRYPPRAIGELKICLRIEHPDDEDRGDVENVLKLARGSEAMLYQSWINLEQRFYIECDQLDYWLADVRVDWRELVKLHRKVDELEAQQNRFIYKPLPRDLSRVPPAFVVMMPNPSGANTLGAPLLVLQIDGPRFRYLRVKEFKGNSNFNKDSKEKSGRPRMYCLELSREIKEGHDDTPVLVFESDSPEMREPSYVEVGRKPKWALLDQIKTWCWPPVRITAKSLEVLWWYMDRLPESTNDAPNTSVEERALPGLPARPPPSHHKPREMNTLPRMPSKPTTGSHYHAVPQAGQPPVTASHQNWAPGIAPQQRRAPDIAFQRQRTATFAAYPQPTAPVSTYRQPIVWAPPYPQPAPMYSAYYPQNAMYGFHTPHHPTYGPYVQPPSFTYAQAYPQVWNNRPAEAPSGYTHPITPFPPGGHTTYANSSHPSTGSGHHPGSSRSSSGIGFHAPGPSPDENIQPHRLLFDSRERRMGKSSQSS